MLLTGTEKTRRQPSGHTGVALPRACCDLPDIITAVLAAASFLCHALAASVTSSPGGQVVPIYAPDMVPYTLHTLNLSECAIGVWSNGKGDYFQTMFTALLHAAFPTARAVVWTHNPAALLPPAGDHCVLPLGLQSHFVFVQKTPFPSDIPIFTWSGVCVCVPIYG